MSGRMQMIPLAVEVYLTDPRFEYDEFRDGQILERNVGDIAHGGGGRYQCRTARPR